ncbi:hypothetical protein TELCIR_09051 [Teladorsagia circumcincta]|uniref:Bestrophin homolog n=1 Tax=Teladorsagia circumcincta TaxID=45464 RepID=A0A2G9UFV5_TELCI|nr:hypothetical protein TELCIR_09051 [Teladorsagia circumcincta]
MTALQFVFYMGWKKVIEGVINPFGEDDDDFETNALIDRNITMGMMIVDQGYDRPPEVRRDPFWEGTHPLYSEETSHRSALCRLTSSTSEIVMMPHSRIGNRSAPAFSTEASVRKSVRVKKIHHCISSLLPSVKRARSKKEEKPPIVIIAAIPVEPPTIDEIILGTDTRPISIAIPTESPVYNEKFVFNIKQ